MRQDTLVEARQKTLGFTLEQRVHAITINPLKEFNMTTTKLTDAQREVIRLATYRPDGNIEPLPPNLRGGARIKVIEGLLAREMIVHTDTPEADAWFLTDAAYAAVGRPRPEPEIPIDPEIETVICAHEEKWQAEKQEAAQRLIKVGVESEMRGKPRTRENERSEVSRGEAERVRSTRQNSKQAKMIGALKSPLGATIGQLMLITGWQAHSLRGQLSNLKKTGLAITSEKKDGERVYYIQGA